MSNRSRYEWYCVLVCIIAIVAIVIFGGRSILNCYYYYVPEAGLNPVYQLDYESPFPPKKLPPEFVVEKSDAEKIEYQKQKYESDLIQYKYEVGLELRQSFIYFLLFIFVFVGHFRSLRHAKN